MKGGGAWVAQLVQRLTFAQVVILAVREFEPHIGLSAVSAEPALDPLPPFSAPPCLCSLSLSLSLKNK